MMNYVGCDIGKSYFDVFLGGNPFKFENKEEGIMQFISRCKEQNVDCVVLEPTGSYERKLLRALCANALTASIVNPFYVRNFARAKRDLAKTDKIDSKILAEYGEKRKPRLYIPKEEYRFECEELTHRQDVLVETMTREKLRLEKEPPRIMGKSIHKVLKFLSDEVSLLDRKIQER